MVDNTDISPTYRAHRKTDISSESTVHHNSRTLFVGGPPRSRQCTTSQYAPKLSSLQAGGDATGRRRAPPLVTVHRREANTSHSREGKDCEAEASEAAPFFLALDIVAVKEQQRKSGPREVKRDSSYFVAPNLRCHESQAMIDCISSSMYLFFRFFRYF